MSLQERYSLKNSISVIVLLRYPILAHIFIHSRSPSVLTRFFVPFFVFLFSDMKQNTDQTTIIIAIYDNISPSLFSFYLVPLIGGWILKCFISESALLLEFPFMYIWFKKIPINCKCNSRILHWLSTSYIIQWLTKWIFHWLLKIIQHDNCIILYIFYCFFAFYNLGN